MDLRKRGFLGKGSSVLLVCVGLELSEHGKEQWERMTLDFVLQVSGQPFVLHGNGCELLCFPTVCRSSALWLLCTLTPAHLSAYPPCT